jgi:glycosyltransferase involved in cell wall biosynthesis
MSLGKPIVGSRIGGIPEQIEDGKTGFLFEMGNVGDLAKKIAKLAIDRDLRYRMGKTARGKIEREYSLASHCKGLLDIYSEVLGRDIRVEMPGAKQ